MSVEQELRNALNLVLEKEESYGHTWVTVGKMTAALFPTGVLLNSEEDFQKFHILQWKLGKLARYVNSNDKDSIVDDGVYSFILASIIEDEKEN